MNPHTHFLFPFAIALILNRLGVVSWKLALVCGIVGVVVDADHYAEHLLKAKTQRFSFMRAWNDAIRFHHFDERSSIHHLNGFLVLSLIFFDGFLF